MWIYKKNNICQCTASVEILSKDVDILRVYHVSLRAATNHCQLLQSYHCTTYKSGVRICPAQSNSVWFTMFASANQPRLSQSWQPHGTPYAATKHLVKVHEVLGLVYCLQEPRMECLWKGFTGRKASNYGGIMYGWNWLKQRGFGYSTEMWKLRTWFGPWTQRGYKGYYRVKRREFEESGNGIRRKSVTEFK